MMLANVLTLNFTILCMTERLARSHENFTVDLGIDVFDELNIDQGVDSTSANLHDFDVTGVTASSVDFDWKGFRLARHNPALFLRTIKAVAVTAGKRMAERDGRVFDANHIDFNAFRNGFNSSDLSPEVATQVRDYLFRKIRHARDGSYPLDTQRRTIDEWRQIRADDVLVDSVTWNGVISGRIWTDNNLDSDTRNYQYTPTHRALLFAIIAVGALAAIFPVICGIERVGCRNTFAVVGLVSTISTAVCPLAASLGFFPFLAVRFIQGVGFASCFPMIGGVTAAWATLSENGLFNGALTSFIQLAPVITMPMAGLLCSSSFGWPSVYYLHALITATLVVLWWIVYRDAPSEHSRVNIAELRKIRAGKFPLKAIFSERSVWAVWIAAVGNMSAIQLLISFSPTFIREVGWASALPTLLQFGVKMFAGMLSDRMRSLSETLRVKLFNSIAFVGMATLLLSLALISGSHHFLSLCCLILSVAVLGFNTGGFFKSATLVGRQYAYFVNTIVQVAIIDHTRNASPHVKVIMCVALLAAPILVYSLTPNNSPGEWSVVFVVHAALLFLCNGVFCLIGSGLPAAFTASGTANKRTCDTTPMKGGELEQADPTTAVTESGGNRPTANNLG